MNSILALFFPPALSSALCVAGWVSVYHWQPAIPKLVYNLLTLHPWLTGVWLALAVVGIDFGLVATRNAVGFRNVGSKARAQWNLGGGR